MKNHSRIRKTKVMVIAVIVLALFLPMGTDYSHGDIIPPDRIIDWSPGVPGGIPNRSSICANVRNAPYSARGDGVADDTTAIQRAINDCSEGQVVYLPRGTYRVTNQLNITRGIVLRGDGPVNTRILNYKNSTGDIIRIDADGNGSAINIISGYGKGSRTLTVANATGLRVGDYISVYQDNNNTLVNTTGCEGRCSWCGDSGQHTMAQIVRITGISGSNLTINRPLYHGFSSTLDPEIKKLTVVDGAGIENLYLEKMYGGGSYNYTNNIRVIQAVNSWVKNVESANAVGAHIRMEKSYGCEVRDSYFHHGHSYDGGRAYGVFLFNRNSDVLVENNIFHVLRHAMVLESGGSGNVFAYNFSKDPLGNVGDGYLFSDIATHGAHPYMNLFEGNRAAHIDIDNVWGSSSHNTFFRNWVERRSSPPNDTVNSGLFAVEVQANNYYENFVGNILCYEGCGGEVEPAVINSSSRTIWKLGYFCSGSSGQPSDSGVSGTILRHGNYEYITNTTHWDPDIPDRNLPDSLYLSSKPAFFGSKPWPIFGPDLSPMIGTLPAEERFNSPTDSTKPMPPQNLRRVDN